MAAFRTILAATLPVVIAVPALAAECVPTPPERLPDPVTCLAEVDPRPPADASAAQQVEVLVKAAKRDIESSRHTEAERALDCAEAVLRGRGDIGSRHAVVRTRASLAYARDRMPEAKTQLTCALRLATTLGDREAMASDINAIGSTLRRLGDYRGALDALVRSLEMQRADGAVGGAVLNNLADLYRERGEHDDALRYYREARQVFLDKDNPEKAAHVLESMAVVEMARDQPREAGRWLEEALGIYRERNRIEYALRTFGRLIQASLAQGDIPAAARWKAAGLAMASGRREPLPTIFQWQVARLERVTGDAPGAVSRLQTTLSTIDAYDADRVDLLQELALAQETVGDRAAALDTLRRAHAQSEARAKARYDLELGWQRTLFETAERDRTIVRLESDNRQRTLQLWLTVAVAAMCLLGFGLLFQRRRQRERLEEAARLARKEEELARYRREADALAEDRQLLQALLDSREDAVCLLDADGMVLAANRAACRFFDRGERGPVGESIVDALAPCERAALLTALERMEDAERQTLVWTGEDARPVLAVLSPWPQGDGLIVLELRVAPSAAVAVDASDAATSVVADDRATTSDRATASVSASGMSAAAMARASADRPSGDRVEAERADLGRTDVDRAAVDGPDADLAGADRGGTTGDAQDDGIGNGAVASETRDEPVAAAELREEFRRALVALMLSALEIWERSTGSGRLELAEQSRIWRVAVDDGRVRARAMERYLTVSRLPQNPRWRDVVRTAYHVLQHCTMEEAARVRLQGQVDAVLGYTRRSALV